MGRMEPPLRNISDTALGAAVYRARETERPDALFRDPFARRLARERGEQIAEGLAFSNNNTWAWMARTYLFDRFVEAEMKRGADLVINLAAGLDARPYRMELPRSLLRVEIDLPEILAYKTEILAAETPRCALERAAMDLSDSTARRELFGRLAGRAKRAVIVAEGFLIYLTAEEVGSLARDLARLESFKSWIVDLASPGLVRMLQKKMGAQLHHGGAALQFGPSEGPGFFSPYGWTPTDVRSLLKTAAKLKRLSFGMRLLAMLPASNGAQGSRPWGGVCSLSKG